MLGTLVVTPSADSAAIVVTAGYAGQDTAGCTPENGYENCIVARRFVAFIGHTRLTLPIEMASDCVNVPCGALTTCKAGACVSSKVECSGGGCSDLQGDAGAQPNLPHLTERSRERRRTGYARPMGKLDDMRRQREQQFADAEQRQAKAARTRPVEVVAQPARSAAPVSAEAEPEPSPTRPKRAADPKAKTWSKSGGAVNEQGKCPDCGKMKPVSNGLLASHQKGFGKACAGSRKKPV